MTNITINTAARSIELSKKFATAAAKFGSDEYKMLQEARRDYPDYKVVEISRKNPKSNKSTFKGLTYEYMETYILAHDDEKQTVMTAYMTLRGETNEADDANASSTTYMAIKEWFLEKYPQIAQFHEARSKMLDEVQQKREAARLDKQKAAKEARRNALLSRKSA